MTKALNQTPLLERIKTTANKVIFTNLPHLTLAEAQAAVPKVEVAITAANFGAIVAGDVSGKKLSFLELTGSKVVGTNADNTLNKIQHANFFAGSAHSVTSDMVTAKNVNAGDDFNISAFDVLEITDPA